MTARRLTWLLAEATLVWSVAYLAVREPDIPFSEEVARKALLAQYRDSGWGVHELESQPAILSDSSSDNVVWQIGKWQIDSGTLRYEYVPRKGFLAGGYFERSWTGAWVAREDRFQ